MDEDEILIRMKTIEIWKNEQEKMSAINENEMRHMDSRFDNIEKRFDRIDAHFSKFMWVFFSSIIAVVVAFMVKGGFVGA